MGGRIVTGLVCSFALLLGGSGLAYGDEILPTPSGDGLHVPVAGSSQAQLPVPYNIAQGLVIGSAQPYADPPGANNFGCKPTKNHPNPVVLVHGGVANKSNNWQTLSPLLANHGYCVFALTYGQIPEAPFPVDQLGGADYISKSAQSLKDFVARVRAATGARNVDLVAASEGGMVVQYYLHYLDGTWETDEVVSIAGVVKGLKFFPTNPPLAVARALGQYDAAAKTVGTACGACVDITETSDLARRLNRQQGGPTAKGVHYTTVVSRYDELITPPSAGQLDGPNVTNIVVQDGCAADHSDHLSIVATRRTARTLLNALDPDDAKSLPCDPVLPLMGSDNVPFVPIPGGLN